MKIEVTDRELWLTKVSTAQSNMDNDYNLRLSQYKPSLIERIFLEEPNVYWDWYDELNLKHLRRALLSEGTGAIYVDEDELRSLEAWQWQD